MISHRRRNERRQSPRKLLEVEVSLSCNEMTTASHTFSVYDISLRGMAMHSDSLTPQVDTQLFLCLSPRREQCRREHIIEATVIHSNPDVVGIRFNSVGVHILKDIQQLLSDERYF